MSFSTEMAKLVTDQISKFVTLNRHQLAGHVANLDFWTAQVRHCLAVLDGYGKRFHQLKTAQARHVAERHITEFSLDDPCCSQGVPTPPRKVPDSELKEARTALCNATRRFLVRCHKEGFIGEAEFRKTCEQLGISFDPIDLGISLSAQRFSP
jgi:hypothetical protein